MIISNFKVTPDTVAPGESMRVEFTVTIESGDVVNGLSISGGPEQRVLYYDNSWKAGVGESATISFISVVPTNNEYINSSLSKSKTQQFTVPDWYVLLGEFGTRTDIPNPVTYVDKGLHPVIDRFTLERAANGMPNDEGENVLASIKISAGAFADTSAASLRLYCEENGEATADSDYIDLTSYIPTLLDGVTDNSSIITGMFSNSGNWGFKLVFSGAEETAELNYVLPRAFANVHLSGDERGGVCFGGFSHGMGAFECHYPAFFYGGIEGVNNYSTNEVKTGGTWIDGKPIYRRTFTGNAGTNKANKAIGNIPDIDTMIDMRGTAVIADYNIIECAPGYRVSGNTTLWCGVYFGASSKNVTVASSYSEGAFFRVTAYYTKSTD